MALIYLENGSLTEGIHELSWAEFVAEFGYTEHRMYLINGLKIALNALKVCNCQRVFIDGSFTTKKEKPGDWDGCFDPKDIDRKKLYDNYPIFFDLVPPRLQQKKIFLGEICPSTTIASPNGDTYLQFFQKDRDHLPKGIVQISLQNFDL